MKQGIGLIAALAVVLLMAGCSSDGGGGATDVQASSLVGTWFGTLTDSVGNLSEHSLTLDGSGNVTGQTVGGAGTGLTATITKETNQVFSFLFSDGSVGGLIVDGVAHQAAFLDDSFHFGVLQKDATALPAYAKGDIVGNWSGPALDTNFSNFNQLTSNADVFGDATITGSDGEGGAFSASVPDVNTTFGVWSKFGGNNYDTSVGTGDFYALMSVNRSFLATWGCITPALAVAPVCRYYGWSK